MAQKCRFSQAILTAVSNTLGNGAKNATFCAVYI
jgi:hypothetical protein